MKLAFNSVVDMALNVAKDKQLHELHLQPSPKALKILAEEKEKEQGEAA